MSSRLFPFSLAQGLATAVCALMVSGCAAQPAVSVKQASVSATGGGPALANACANRDGWSDAAPPAQVFGNVYYVGTCGITALLIVSAEGHVLIDGATDEAAPSILQNIRRLGVDPRDVKYLLSTHEHLDHAGGLAALKKATGARFLARAEAGAVFESGQPDPRDPQIEDPILKGFTPLQVDQVLADEDQVRVGEVVLTAHATPGHTFGSTSWTWRSCAHGQCYAMVYADSISAIAAGHYRFLDHPEYVATFRQSFDKVAALPCDILITPHPSSVQLFERLAGRKPLVDSRACGAYAAAGRARLDKRLKVERLPSP